LENFVRKNETERVSKRLKLNDLSTELSQQIDGRAACSWAVELNVPHCLKILLDFAAKDGPATFKEVTEIQNDKYRIRGYCPCAHAILNNNLECILVSQSLSLSLEISALPPRFQPVGVKPNSNSLV
jgi:hypothetical protein